VGGSQSVPLVRLSSLSVPTAEGIDLVWSDVVVGVVDLPGVDGVFGMNLLTRGYGAIVLAGLDLGDLLGSADVLAALVEYGLLDSGGATIEQLLSLFELLSTGSEQPYFQQAVFDFTEPGSAVLRLDLNPEVNKVVPEPGGIAMLGVLCVALRRRRRSTAE